jgi:hypothetical protein
MAADCVNIGNPDDGIEFVISMAARLRTAARAADELGQREVQSWLAMSGLSRAAAGRRGCAGPPGWPAGGPVGV